MNFGADFTEVRIATSGAEINLKHGGTGPPLLLLHGYPQTHAIWQQVAPRLAQDFHVICPDLRGYGDSSKSPSAVIPTAAGALPPGVSDGGRLLGVVDTDRSAYVVGVTLRNPQSVERLRPYEALMLRSRPPGRVRCY